MTVRKYRELSITELRDVVDEGPCVRGFQFSSSHKRILIDNFTASAIVNAYDTLTVEMKAKVERMISEQPEEFWRIVEAVYH